MEEKSGTLAVQVLVFNPDCEEALQIASIRSRPQDGSCNTALLHLERYTRISSALDFPTTSRLSITNLSFDESLRDLLPSEQGQGKLKRSS